MDLVLDLRKSLEQNAAENFEKAKKYRKKSEGAILAVARLKKQIEELEKTEHQQTIKQASIKRVKAWFEKFRWFYSSEGFLVIGGRDATSNELVIKKHTAPEDIVFHTEAPGSPFFVIKTEGREPKETIDEAASATVSYSRAWKLGLSIADVYWVKPDQVSKTAEAGTSLPKGAFMIYGKRHMMQKKLEVAIGRREDGAGIGGPITAIKAQTSSYIVVEPGKEKSSDIAKLLVKKFGGMVEDYQSFIPGTCRITNA